MKLLCKSETVDDQLNILSKSIRAVGDSKQNP